MTHKAPPKFFNFPDYQIACPNLQFFQRCASQSPWKQLIVSGYMIDCESAKPSKTGTQIQRLAVLKPTNDKQLLKQL